MTRLNHLHKAWPVKGGHVRTTQQATNKALPNSFLAYAMGVYLKTKVLPVPNGGKAIPDVRLSDHSPFWDLGYNAMMVTDTSFMRNPHYHKMSDTVETLDLPFFTSVVNGLDEALKKP